MTDLSALRLPGAFVARAAETSRDREVLLQPIEVDLDWWNTNLGLRGLPGRVEAEGDGSVVSVGHASMTRSRLFDLAAGADSDGERALDLLWHTLAWGAGRSARNMVRRLDSVRADRERAVAALVEAARLSRSDPKGAYEVLRPGRRNLLPYLGPAFFSKYLYFAGGGDPAHRCLILDARVASALRLHGWKSLHPGGSWPSLTYARYCDLLSRWSEATSRSDRPVAADEIELWLFESRGVGAGG